MSLFLVYKFFFSNCIETWPQFFLAPKTAAGSISQPILAGLVPVLFVAPAIARFPKEAPGKPEQDPAKEETMSEPDRLLGCHFRLAQSGLNTALPAVTVVPSRPL